jgi:uncharacterized membrane protein HdeD (DUF308 family)
MTADRVAMPSPPKVGDLRTWWRRLTGLNGFITLAIGIIILVWSRETLSVLSILLGIWLIVAGAVHIWRTLVEGGGRSSRFRMLSGLAGVVYLVAGFLLVFRPFHTITFLAIVLGIAMIAFGASEVLSNSKRQEGWKRLSQFAVGAISVIGGFIVLIWPSRTLLTVIRVAAIALIAIGLVQIITAFRARRRAVDGRPGTSA